MKTSINYFRSHGRSDISLLENKPFIKQFNVDAENSTDISGIGQGTVKSICSANLDLQFEDVLFIHIPNN